MYFQTITFLLDSMKMGNFMQTVQKIVTLQGAHILEKLNSLRLPSDFQVILSFSLSKSKEKNPFQGFSSLGKSLFVFSLSFPTKIQAFLSFPCFPDLRPACTVLFTNCQRQKSKKSVWSSIHK